MNKSELGRRERKRERTKQGLVHAATELFVSKGFAQTTIDDVAAAADVAKVTFYYYFKSKEEIVLEIKKNCVEEACRYAEKLVAEELSVPEILRVLISDIVQWTEENWRLLEVFSAQRFSPLMQESNCYDPDKASPMVLLMELIIAYGQKIKQFRQEIDPKEVANLIALAIFNEQCTWVQEGRKQSILKTRIQHCFDIILHGICQN